MPCKNYHTCIHCSMCHSLAFAELKHSPITYYFFCFLKTRLFRSRLGPKISPGILKKFKILIYTHYFKKSI